MAAIRPSRIMAISFALGVSVPLMAAVLPDDRADALYHSYEGGGLSVTGPLFSVRKQLGSSLSLAAYSYVDSISSATIDVVTTASPYTEHREEVGYSIDVLHDKTNLGAGYSKSEESDYVAETAYFNVKQSFFGDLTTLSLGYAQGNDVVRPNLDPKYVKRHNYTIGISQVLTKDWLLALDYDSTTDEGFLNNPYRRVRIAGAFGATYEAYPTTHTSNAAAIRFLYYLPYRASVGAEYRYFTDSWGIEAMMGELKYNHPLESGWEFGAHYRYYTQTRAAFFSDDFSAAQNYMARDKEMSTFQDQTIGVSASYTLGGGGWGPFEKGSINAKYDRISFDYKDFYDVRDGTPYQFDANVYQLFLSLWY